MDRLLIYVSRKALSGVNPEREVAEIVDAARSHNEKMGITGALAATQDHFAQLLEGPSAALDELMEKIERDPRHTEITVLRVDAIWRRRLAGWSMAYAGTSSYVARQVEPLIGASSIGKAIRTERLVSLLVGLAGSA